MSTETLTWNINQWYICQSFCGAGEGSQMMSGLLDLVFYLPWGRWSCDKLDVSVNHLEQGNSQEVLTILSSPPSK